MSLQGKSVAFALLLVSGMPTQNFFLYAPVICSVMCMQILFKWCWAVVQVCRFVPGPVSTSFLAGVELSSASGVGLFCGVPSGRCDVSLQTCVTISPLLENIVDLPICREGLFNTWENWEWHPMCRISAHNMKSFAQHPVLTWLCWWS